MTKYRIYNNDILEWCKRYNKIKFHALLGDPPYHLQSIVKRFGKNGSAPAKYGSDGVFQRTSTGFMGQEWDGGEIAFNPETWAMLGEHLYDGAFGFAYAASRNWHRLAVAIEGLLAIEPNTLLAQADVLAFARENKDWDAVEAVENWMRHQSTFHSTLKSAGFIIHPTIFCWVQGQGFPKATNISKQLEKGKKVGTRKTNVGMQGNQFSAKSRTGDVDVVEFETDLDVVWQGHRYGLQALKPSVEPIICFQKPYNGKPLDNITQTGAGALNIDGARIPLLTEGDEYVINTFDDGAKPWGDAKGEKYTSRKLKYKPKGIRSGSGNYVGDNYKETQPEIEVDGRWPANFVLTEETAQKLGEESRFFYTVSYDIDEADPIFYCSKTSTNEKEAGLIGHFPCKTCGQLDSEFHIALDHRTGKEKQIKEKCRRASHPTYKPISLNQWLATLLLPPEMYAPERSLLVPFSGVSSEMIGGLLAGWDRIVGIEQSEEYCEIGRRRMDYYATQK